MRRLKTTLEAGISDAIENYLFESNKDVGDGYHVVIGSGKVGFFLPGAPSLVYDTYDESDDTFSIAIRKSPFGHFFFPSWSMLDVWGVKGFVQGDNVSYTSYTTPRFYKTDLDLDSLNSITSENLGIFGNQYKVTYEDPRPILQVQRLG